jgi:uracil-DNA glycosylase
MEELLIMPPCWQEILKSEFQQEYMLSLMSFLKQEQLENKIIYPPVKEIFSCFHTTLFNNVKVVIIGQDPYHGPSQAHGMAFSVSHGVRPPPSLVNIYKELMSDLTIAKPSHGNLLSWGQQGVLLLNSVLTVEDGKPGSHQKQGWEIFTDKIIYELNLRKNNLVFILWGAPAQKKCINIDPTKHLIIKSPHPSPLSAHRGFFGGKYFSKTNEYLINHKLHPIDWKIS